MKKQILIIIPCYNEENSITLVANNLINNYPQYDYVIVNDCSKDSTLEIIKKHRYNYLSLPNNLGIGGAVQTGYRYAVENNYDYTVQIDGDGQHDPFFIKEMLKTLETKNADMVIGSRFLKKEGFQTSSTRKMGIHIINGILRLTCGVKVTDSTSGLRLCNRNLTAYYSQHYAIDYPEPEAIAAAAMKGYSVTECPVIMKGRESGQSSINVWRSVYYMIKVSLAIILQRVTGKKS